MVIKPVNKRITHISVSVVLVNCEKLNVLSYATCYDELLAKADSDGGYFSGSLLRHLVSWPTQKDYGLYHQCLHFIGTGNKHMGN